MVDQETLAEQAASARERCVSCVRQYAGLLDEINARRSATDNRFALLAQAHVRNAISSYASVLRRMETTPEAALILVKQLLVEARKDTPTTSAELVRVLKRDVVTWTIEGFFEPPARRQG